MTREPEPGTESTVSDFNSYPEAKTWFDHYVPAYGDVAVLDADNDLAPCEELQKVRVVRDCGSPERDFFPCETTTTTTEEPTSTAS